MKIILNEKNKDEIWELIQDSIPNKFLNHWLTANEMKNFNKSFIIIKDNKKLSFKEKLDLLNKNGYNIEEINTNNNLKEANIDLDKNIIGTVRIS